MAAGELAENRKRDRVKALAMRAMAVPLSVRTSDLPKRAASAVVMLALAGTALRLGGLWFDGFVILVAAICLPLFFSGRNLMHRYEGFCFVAAYIAYITYLVWNSSDGGAPGWYADIAWFVAVPLAVVAVIVTAWRDRHREIPAEALR